MGAAPVVLLSQEQLEEIVERAVERALGRVGQAPAPLPATGYLTVAQAAKHAGCSEDTIREWIHAGRLPRRRVGAGRGHYRVALADLEAAMRAGDAPPVDVGDLAARIMARGRR